MMVPVGRLVMLRSVDRSQYVRAMAYLVVPAFIGPVVGPPVGGFITTYVSWRWVFFLNVPIGLVGMVLVTFLIENTREAKSPPLDWLGFVLSGVSLASILYSLDLASHGTARPAWSSWRCSPSGSPSASRRSVTRGATPHPLIGFSCCACRPSRSPSGAASSGG